MNPNNQPGIICEAILLIESNFYRIPEFNTNSKMSWNIEYEIGLNENQGVGTLSLIVKFTHDDLVHAEAKAKYVGIFSVNPSDENMDIEVFMKLSAPPIIFPYLREQISSMSIKAGITPMIVPPINLPAILKNEELESNS